MIRGRGAAAQCAAMAAAALVSARPLLGPFELPRASLAISAAALLTSLATLGFSLRLARASAQATSAPADPRSARRLARAAQFLAAAGVTASLWSRLHDSFVTSTPPIFWFSILGGAALAAWAATNLRPSVVRARFYWALALGLLLAVLASIERPDALARAPRGLERFEPGSGVNLVLGVGALLLGEGHPGSELFALVPLYAPASSAVEPRTPWFRHLSALLASLLIGLAVLAQRSARAGLRSRALSAALFSLAAAALLALPVIAMPAIPGVLDGPALALLAGAAALFSSPIRDAAHPEGVFA